MADVKQVLEKAKTLRTLLKVAKLAGTRSKDITSVESKGDKVWYISLKNKEKIDEIKQLLAKNELKLIEYDKFIAVSKTDEAFALFPYSQDIKPTNNMSPENDDIENNPDKDYILGAYSTFNRDLSNLAKQAEIDKANITEETEPDYNQAVKDGNKDLASDIKRKYNEKIVKIKKAIQNSLPVDEKILEQIAKTMRKDTMDVIINNPALTESALNFSKLSDEEKKGFGQELMNRLSLKYNNGVPGKFALRQDGEAGTYKVETDTIIVDKDIKKLDDFVGVFLHEFGHRVSYKNPNLSVHGSQQAHVAKTNYIGSNNFAEYWYNADETSSFKIEDISRRDFEKDLKGKLAFKGLFQLRNKNKDKVSE